MTQEELDALMNEDIEMDEAESLVQTFEEIDDETDDEIDEYTQETNIANPDNMDSLENPSTYRASALNNWPPPPPTDDNKMVDQLDGVTRESEEKASEIFDLIEMIGNDLARGQNLTADINATINSNITLFTTLHAKFPHVQAFEAQLSQNIEIKEKLNEVTKILQNDEDAVTDVMEIMQYQDIHRQKIERVINVIRALSTYMNQLFSGKIDDSKRADSAVHIHGDTDTEDVVTSDDIEALLASFGQK